VAGIFALCATGFSWESGGRGEIPKAIRRIMEKPRYAEATWALRVVDVHSGHVIYDLNSQQRLLTGSVRKLYSVSDLLNRIGPDYRFKTPVYRRGQVDNSGNLKGDLILVAKADLTMGGRDQGNDTLAISNFDHNDANNLKVGILTAPNPLGGLDRLAKQVAASGITKISGDVIIDDRLFKPFRVPNGNLLVTPIMINDNRIDVTVLPTKPGERARIEWRPKTAAFTVTKDVMTVAAGQKTEVTLTQNGSHAGLVSGQIAVDYKPPFPGVSTFVRTFVVDNPDDVTAPSSLQVPTEFARTTFIEALRRAGVTVDAPLLGVNPAAKLPPPDCYPPNTKVAELVSTPYAQYSKLILKISHNLGANLSLMLFGLSHGVNTMEQALQVERKTLTKEDGLNGEGFYFPTNGSGSPDSEASAETTVDLLRFMERQRDFPEYFRSLPILGVDGSLAEFGANGPARGKVFAKTGTYVGATGTIRAQVLAGYIEARSGRKLAYALFVNDAGEASTPDGELTPVLHVIEDEAEISTIVQQTN
jgi:D-alanyl-D-alanine carboxypeptidase/D-alanyl-D-alanine-endopeptidase (penicillin-binding protein 4)